VLTLHQRRVANELELLDQVAALNPAILRVVDRAIYADSSRVDIELLASPALIRENGALVVEATHASQLRLPRFFPAVPIEIYLKRPVFHPNVDPDTGFVCLWHRFSPDDTCVDAIRRLRQIIAWKMMNPNPLQVIQPDAITWLEDPNRQPAAPLEFDELQNPEPERYFLPVRPPAGGRRKRLMGWN
jgi:ubiquitin-protein ligase